MTKPAIFFPALIVLGLAALGVMNATATPETKTGSQETTTTLALAIENMTCAACPITVRKSMQRVDGVKTVSIDIDTRIATITFDPGATTESEIAKASTDVGFPATPIEKETR
jgi:mercuric ion binding protein